MLAAVGGLLCRARVGRACRAKPADQTPLDCAAALFPVFGAVVTHLPSHLEVWDVPPTTWRHGLALKGNAKKHEVADAVCALACGGSLNHPIRSWSQDAYDAYAVAYYARELNTRGVALDEAREKQLTVL